MKLLTLSVACVCALLLYTSCAKQTKTANKILENKEDARIVLDNDTLKFSYSLGVEIGANINKFKNYMSMEAFIQGIKDTLLLNKNELMAEDADRVKREFFTMIKNEETKNNMEQGAAFLENNKKKNGVTVTSSGLQYEILVEGDGPEPKLTDKVRVNYIGTLIDGTEFDNSYKRGSPAVFQLDQVIKGWSEGVQLLKVGSKARLVIPPDLAYGPRGAGQAIGPNSTLVFEMELLGIEQ
ncbi:MAG: FKBP-type peptidyl-prolyl cis-trans isomerase [bacterium]